MTEKTISDFGEQWTKYTDNSGRYGSDAMFADICHPLLTVEDLVGKNVADIGSGTGRIVNMLVSAGAARVTAIEPSAAFDALKVNTHASADKIDYVRAEGTAIAAQGPFDVVVSIGVLHHIPAPDPVVAAAYQSLRPGGKMFVWLYGREGNEAYLCAALPLRAITTRLPHWVLAGLCYVLDVFTMVYTAATRFIRLPLRDYLQNVYSPLAADKRRLVIYDQLNPQYAKYYTRDEARRLLESNGFTNVEVHHRHGYSWSVIGEKL